jgi:PAS domain S-box-containing protein
MTKSLKVLLVEDRPEDAELLVREMKSGGLAFTSRRVETGPQFEEALDSFSPDLILSDYTLPGFQGTEALEIAIRKRPDTPFIFVSGTIGEERAIQALKQGAVDYVLKDNRVRLVPAIERAMRDVEERDAKRWAQHKLEESEERFRFAMHFSSVGMALVSPDGNWLAVNPALCEIVGYSETELLATDMLSITYPDDREVDVEQIRAMLSRRLATYQCDKRFVRKAGEVVWTQLSGSLVWIKADVPHYFIYQIQDISDRVRAQAALRDSEERFRTIAEATQE